MNQRLLIIGAGELGRQILHYAIISGKYNIIGFVDDTIPIGNLICGFPVIGQIKDVIPLYESGVFDCTIIGIGYNHLKFKDQLYDSLKSSVPFTSIIIEPIYIDKTAQIGHGSFLYPGCIIDKNVIIGDNVILNLNSLVSHDSVISQSTFIAPRVSIAGFSKIGHRCMIGINSTIKDNISIIDDSIIGAGAVVVTNIEQAGTYYGVPAKLSS